MEKVKRHKNRKLQVAKVEGERDVEKEREEKPVIASSVAIFLTACCNDDYSRVDGCAAHCHSCGLLLPVYALLYLALIDYRSVAVGVVLYITSM